MFRKCVEEFIPNGPLKDTDNIFLRGLDSLGAAGLSRKLRIGLMNQAISINSTAVPLNMLYQNPTIEKLAPIIIDIIFGRYTSETTNDALNMELTLQEFTKCLPTKSAQQDQLYTSERLNVVLIGPRGSLGPHIVKSLLLNPLVESVICLNRGEDGRERFHQALKTQGLSLPQGADDRISFISVALGEPNFGLTSNEYAELSKKAHIIMHNAWKVGFSWTLESYKNEHLHSIRSMVDFAAEAAQRPRIVFISSISSVQAWASIYQTPVTEAPFEDNEAYNVASPLGYGQSKHVSERILTQESKECGIPVTILRVGQVAGSTTATGAAWTTDEWIPSLASIPKTLKLIPSDIPAIDWIPVNKVAQAICELALAQESNKEQPDEQLKIFNVVNPHLADWGIFVEVLRKRLGDSTRIVTLAEWVDRLARTDPKSMSDAEAISSTNILPFFQHLASTAASGAALQPGFYTTNSVKMSRAMAEMQAVDGTLIDLWCQQWGI
jgi:thioester reductase-like protein